LVILALLPAVAVESVATAAASLQPHQGQFFALTPARVLNTSTGLGTTAGAIAAGGTKNVSVLGAGGVPATGVSAVVLSLTVVAPTAATTETVWPAGGTKPVTAALTAPSGVTVTSTVTSAVGTSGQISVYNSAGTAQLYGDVVGYYSDGTNSVAGSTYVPVTQSRILNTSSNVGHAGAIGANASFDLSVTGVGGVPASNVTAVAMVLTAVKPSATESFTVYPTGATRPATLSLSATANVAISTTVVSAVSSSGQITIYNNTGSTNLYGDIVGYWQSPAAAASGAAFTSVTQTRVLSTTTQLSNGGTLNVAVTGVGGVPSSGVSTVWLYLTAVAPTGATTLTAYPAGSTRPGTATVSTTTSTTRTNLVAAVPGAGGQITIYNSTGKTNLYVDVVGYTATALAPTAPAAPSAAAGNGQATVTWAPPNDGGAAITSYTATAAPGGASATVDGSATSATVVGLTNGSPYTFTVTAANAAGASPASPASSAVTPAGPPGAPTGVSATAADSRATVTWAAPPSNGSPITGYTVTAAPGGATATVAGTVTSATVTGLANGTAYTFTVTATNAAGTSASSTPSGSVTPLGPPGAPTAVTASARNQSAVVSWAAPANNGGQPITGYTVQTTPGATSISVDGATTATTVTGLTNGTAYTFTVTATNSNGTGPGATATATPQPAPGDVTTAIDTASVSTVAGGFNSPRGVAVTGGFGYVAGQDTISKVDLSSGVSSVLAGSPGSRGCSDASTGANAQFNYPSDMATDGAYGYLLDQCGLRRVSLATGATQTLAAGGLLQWGCCPVSASYLTLGVDGNVYVTGNNSVVKVNLTNGATSTVATFPAGTYSNSPGSAYGITSDSNWLYVGVVRNDWTDANHCCTVTTDSIYKVAYNGSSSTVLTNDNAMAFRSLESAGAYIYGATNTGAVRRYTKADGSWRNIAGAGTNGSADGVGSDAWFQSGVQDLAADGTNLWVLDGGNLLRKLAPASPLPSGQQPAVNTAAAIDTANVSTAARGFNSSRGVVVAGGFGYVANQDTISKVDLSSGATTVLAGLPGSTGCSDSATGAGAQMNYPTDMATDGHYAYTIDSGCGLRRISLATGATQILASGLSADGYLTLGADGNIYLTAGNGVNTWVTRYNPVTGVLSPQIFTFPAGSYSNNPGRAYGITSDANWLYVADIRNDWTDANHCCTFTTDSIFKISYDGASSSILTTDNGMGFHSLESAGGYIYGSNNAGGVRRYSKTDGSWRDIAGAGTNGSADGVGSDAWFQSGVQDLAADGTNLWAVDGGNLLRKLAPTSPLPSGQQPAVNTAAAIDTANVSTTAGGFNNPRGVVVAGGFGYVASQDRISKVDLSSGATTVLAGLPGSTGCSDSATGAGAQMNNPIDMATDGHYAYTIDSGCGLRRISLATGATQTVASGLSADGYLTLGADGNIYLTAGNGVNTWITRYNPVTGVLSPQIFTFPAGSYSNSPGRAYGITSDANWLYVADIRNDWTDANHCCTFTTDSIFKVAYDGTTSSILTTDNAMAFRSLESAGSYIYGTNNAGAVRRYSKTDGSWRNIAGAGTSGSADGVGTDAWFQGGVNDIAADGTNLWTVDGGNLLRKLAPTSPLPSSQQAAANTATAITSGTVTTFAGSGSASTVAGTGPSAGFNTPRGVVTVGGFAYLANVDAISKVDLSSGATTVLAGLPGAAACTDSPVGASARINNPIDMATDGYYAYTIDSSCGLRRISLATGATQTIASGFSADGYLTLGADGNIYLTAGNGVNTWITRYNPSTGVLTQQIFTFPTGTYSNSPGRAYGITSDANWLYVADIRNDWTDANHCCVVTTDSIFKVAYDGATSSVLTTDNAMGFQSIESAGAYVYGSTNTGAVRRYSKSDGSVISIAGPGTGEADGVGSAAGFSARVNDLADDGNILWVVDAGNKLREISAAPLPLAPSNVSASGGNTQATVSWSAPVDNGSGTITGYTVTASPGGRTATTSGATSVIVTGLTNGTAYTFTVRATTAAGSGPNSAPSAAVTPAGPPGAPTSVTGTPGDKHVDVSWTAPADNGGSAVTGYTVTASPGGATASTTGATTATISGLTNGTAYTFTVTATTAAGTGPASAASAGITPVGPPSAPLNVSAAATNAQATVSWSAPANNGGHPITGYTVTASPGGATASTSGATSATVTGLTNGTSYTFTVTASNDLGAGVPSQPSGAVTPGLPPNPPTAVQAVGGDATATVSWSPPSDASRVTGYTVTAAPGGTTATTTGATTVQMSGLTNGTSYTFTVVANSDVGSSTSSDPSNAVTPIAHPGPVLGVTATQTLNNTLDVKWTPPSSGIVTSYLVSATPGNISRTVGRLAIGASIGGLAAGTTYTVTVVAQNSVGYGPVVSSQGTVNKVPLSSYTDVAWANGNKVISDDGRWVAYTTAPTENGSDINTGWYSVYLQDTQQLVTYNIGGVASGTSPARWNVSMSADARYIVFNTAAALISSDTDGRNDVYLYDRQNDTLSIVSASAQGALGNGDNANAMISADGSTVVFESTSTNLGPAAPGGNVYEAYTKNLATGAVDLDSVDALGGAWSTGIITSSYPQISGNGQYVAFDAQTTVPINGNFTTLTETFRRDRVNQVTATASLASDGNPVYSGSRFESMSRDGRQVAFGANDSINSGQTVTPGTPSNSGDDYIRYMNDPITIMATVDSNGHAFYSAWGTRFSPDGTVVTFDAGSGTAIYMRSQLQTQLLVAGSWLWFGYTDGVFAADNQTLLYTWVDEGYSGKYNHAYLSHINPKAADQGSVRWTGWRESVNPATGSYVSQANDVNVASAGPPLQVQRTYNSSNTASGAFGVGFTFNYEMTAQTAPGADPSGAMTINYGDGRQLTFHGNGSNGYNAPNGYSDQLSNDASGGGHTLVQKDGETFHFTIDGVLDSITDANGRTLTLSYTNGQLTTVTNAASGRHLTFGWGGGHITSVSTDSVGSAGGPLTWTYHYTGNLLTSACQPADGGTACTGYTYNGNNQLSGISNAAQQAILDLDYYSDHRVQHVGDGAGHDATFSYPSGLQVSVTDKRGNTTTQNYDSNLELTSEVNPYGKIRSYGYTNGERTSTTDENGNTTSSTYNPNGDQLTSTDGVGHTTYYSYDGSDNPTAIRDPRSASASDNTYATTLTYDSHHNLLTETQPATSVYPNGITRTWTYSSGTEAACDSGAMPAGLRLTVTDWRGKTTRYTYTHRGDVCTVTTPLGQVTSYSYDELGRVTARTVTSDSYPAGVTTTYSYDAAGQLLTETGPAIANAVTGVTHQRRVSRGYDDAERLTSVTTADLAGHDPTRVTTYTEDAWGRVATTRDSQTNQTVYRTYDPNGNLTDVTDQLGRHYSLSYDKNNRLTTTVLTNFTSPTVSGTRAVTVSSLSYDDAGRIVTRTDAKGRVTQYSYDRANRQTATTLIGYHNRDGSTRNVVTSSSTYDAAGDVTDAYAGNSLRHTRNTYDADGRLVTSVLDPAGLNRSTSYTYNEDGQPTTVTVTDANSSVTTATGYDDGGDVTSRTVDMPTGNLTTSYSYDTRGLLRGSTDPRGNLSGANPADYTTTYSYDQLGERTAVSAPSVTVEESGVTTTSRPTTTTGYNTFGQPASTRDPRGNVTTYNYDAAGRVTDTDYPTYTPPGGEALHPAAYFSYDDTGNLTAATNTRGFTTEYAYDALNRPVRQTDPAVGNNPAGQVTTGYDDAGNVVSRIDQTGATTTYTVDDLNRLRATDQTIRHAGGADTHAVTTTDYNDLGDPVYQQTPAGDTSSATYSPAGDRLGFTDPAGKHWTYTYDLGDQLTSVTDPLGRKTSYGYDAAERPTSTRSYDAIGVQVAQQAAGYDAAGNVIGATNADGYQTTFSYDALDRLLTSTVPVDATNSITSGYGYDAAGNRTRVTDGRGYASDGSGAKLPGSSYDTVLTYTPSNQIATVIEPATAAYPNASDRTWTNSYDAGDLLTREDQPGNVSVTHTYDALGRDNTDTGTTSGTTTTKQFGYDLAGRLTSFSTPTGTQSVTYDDRGLPTSLAGPDGATTATYDPSGRLTNLTDPAGAQAFTYNSRGLLATASNLSAGITLTNGYDDAGELSSTVAAAGSATSTRSYTYDGLGRVIDDQLTVNGATRADLGYGYDPQGNVTTETVTEPGNAGNGASTYTYDRANRLTSWLAPDTTDTTYRYDAAGNRTQAGSAVYTYDAQNRLLAGPNTSYTYSPRGTLATVTANGTTTTSSYDAFNRLISSGSQTYGYDALDRLASINATTLQYSGFDNQPANDGNGLYFRGPDGNLLTTTMGGGTAVTAANVHGDLTYLYGADGTVTGSQTFDPYGAATHTAGTTPPVGFQSQLADPATGNVWMNARWYNPASATFTSEDTVLGAAANPISLDRYAYAGDNPASYADPSGHCPISSTGWGDCSTDEGPRSFSVSAAVGLDMNPSVLTKYALAPSAPPGVSGNPCTGDVQFICDYMESNALAAAVGDAFNNLVGQPLTSLIDTINTPSQWGSALANVGLDLVKSVVTPFSSCINNHDLLSCASAVVTTAAVLTGVGAIADGLLTAGADVAVEDTLGGELAGNFGTALAEDAPDVLTTTAEAAAPEGELTGAAAAESGGGWSGTIYRAVPKQYEDSAWTISDNNLAASHRYSGPGLGALYGSTSHEGVLAELEHYGIDPATRAFVSRDVTFENVLDLTDAGTRERLGVSFEDLTQDDYSVTQRLGSWASNIYDAMVVPSARFPGGTNVVIFGELP
jgi:RHS repeat-associated protein